MEHGSIHRTLEYYDHEQNVEYVELRIHFTFTPGCAAQTYGPAEDCYPAEGAEVEFVRAEREAAPGKWAPVANGEWLEGWCRAALESSAESDVIAGLPDREDA